MKIKIIDEGTRNEFNFLPDKEYEATCKKLTEGRHKGNSVYFARNEDGRLVGFNVPAGKTSGVVRQVT